MSLNFNLYTNKAFGCMVLLSVLACSSSYAYQPLCSNQSHPNYCKTQYKTQVDQINKLYFTSNLVTNAPLRLLQDTQHMWHSRLKQCKNKSCFEQQFNLRAEDLNAYSALNQSLTQHFIKYHHGKIAQPQTYLQIHQLDQNKMKIEGWMYRNPNASLDKLSFAFLSYLNNTDKTKVTNNETTCRYQFNYQKTLLVVTSTNHVAKQNCQRFTGIYRLYD
ncbi:A1S_1983 family putative colistin resistance protein [Acinetobacter sp. ANC 4636]